ncbi:MAG: hypothetical protein NW216_02500 [Hyphomicrobium sp.]|nr:hypothetical protein [Hyphomicrobium sp.]
MSSAYQAPRSLMSSLSGSELANSGRGGTGALAADPSAFDRDIASLFTELRAFLGWPAEMIAKQLGTHLNVVLALEQGHISRLPDWPETQRIVIGYVALVGVPAEPVLNRLRQRRGLNGPGGGDMPAFLVAAAATGQMPKRGGAPGTAHEDTGPGAMTQLAGRLSRPVPDHMAVARSMSTQAVPASGQAASAERSAFGVSAIADQAKRLPLRLAIMVAGGLGLLALTVPTGMLRASVDHLPGPVSGVIHSLADSFGMTITVREGHRWIDVANPRTRRADKLPPQQR